MKIHHEITFILLLALSGMTQAQASLSNAIVAIHKDPNARTPTIDVTQVVQKYIPINSDAENTANILKSNGFEVESKIKKETHYLIGSKEIERHFIGYVETRIIMTVVNGKITTIKGLIFRHTL